MAKHFNSIFYVLEDAYIYNTYTYTSIIFSIPLLLYRQYMMICVYIYTYTYTQYVLLLLVVDGQLMVTNKMQEIKLPEVSHDKVRTTRSPCFLDFGLMAGLTK